MTAVALSRHRPPPDPRLLQRCLLLAMLLHVWLVLMFGNATGTAAPGQGVWGSLTVKLMGRSGGDTGSPSEQPSGEAPQAQRPSGAQTPGAADLGRWNPREVAPEAARTDEPSPAPPSTATLNLPEGFRPVEREALDTPAPRRLAPTESPVLPLRPAEPLDTGRPVPQQAPAPELPAAVGRLETRPDASVTPLPAPVNLRSPSTPATELPALPTEMPAPVRRLEATPPGSVTPLQRPPELRLPGAAAPTAAAAPNVELPAPVRRLEAVTDAGAGVAPLQRSTDLRAPSAAATTPVAPPSAELPAAVRRLEAADGGTTAPVTPLQAATGTRPAPAAAAANALPELSSALPGEVAAPAGPARGDPTANPFAAPKASPGSPDAGPRLGPNLPTPPTAAASAPRAPLNLSLPRGDMTAKRGPGLVDLVPPPPERKSKLEQSIEDATNKDCRKAYSNAGILAAVPLAIDAARGKGCKW